MIHTNAYVHKLYIMHPLPAENPCHRAQQTLTNLVQGGTQTNHPLHTRQSTVPTELCIPGQLFTVVHWLVLMMFIVLCVAGILSGRSGGGRQ